MKKVLIFISLIIHAGSSFANLNFIDINKISTDNKCIVAYNYVKDHETFYDHWSNQWNYDKPKNEVISKLHEYYSVFLALPSKNTESYLLLGDISAYLYNLDDSSYFQIAVNDYKEALKLSPKDYRCYWFLGLHYALSAVPKSAVENLLTAEKLLPSDQPSEFWNNYSWSMDIAQMPSHCIYGMAQVRKITGEEGYFEKEVGNTVIKRMVEFDKDSSYDKKEIWTGESGDKDIFTSRPLGIKMLIDTSWNLDIYGYSGRQSAFVITPSSIKNAKGKGISYSIALIMKVADSGERLVDYVDKLIAKHPDKKTILFSNRYKNMVSYEIKDKTMYEDIGGGHLYMIGVERESPEFSGLQLENPELLPLGTPGQVSYYRGTNVKTRFKGKIFYAILLDSCEDIHDQSLAIFKELFDNQMVIE